MNTGQGELCVDEFDSKQSISWKKNHDIHNHYTQSTSTSPTSSPYPFIFSESKRYV